MWQRIKAIIRKIPISPKLDPIREQAKKVFFRLAGGTKYTHNYYNAYLSKALTNHFGKSDISDHLGAIFFFAMGAKPKLIVELGTRGGQSTLSLLAAAFLSKAVLLSIDIVDCELMDLPFRDNWHFVQADDIEFGNLHFISWCSHLYIEPIIDVLLVDTSHKYEHTKKEIETWFRYLSDEGIMIFHDTNMGKGIYSRTDGSVDIGWDNNRGVIRAIEDFVGRNYDENSFCYDFTKDMLLIHYPYCSGLTILKKHKIIN
jgi:predicted O-methyltransferase YrrM